MPEHDFSRPTSYFDARFGRDAIKILPGQYYVTNSDKLIVTVLGSCVAVCLYDPISEVGGMNHFMLPSNNTVSAASFEANRYGVHAMEVLLNDCLNLGAEKKRLVAKVFGGARVLPGYIQNDIGATNAAFGLEFLQTERIPVLAHDLLKDYARKVYFTPADGSVIMKRIYDMHNNTIYEREAELAARVNSETRRTGTVDIFDR